MNISVIISTWNNSRRLAITLESLTRCAVPSNLTWELVLVNNNCTDDTDRIVEQYHDRLPINYVKEPRQGLSAGRNAGLKNASGELIIFTDDDIKAPKGWMADYWAAYKTHPTNYFFGGSVVSEFEGKKPAEDLLNVAMPSVKGLELGNSERLLKKNEYFIAANWAIPERILSKVGVFDETLGLNPQSGKVKVGEESDLMDRMRSAGFIPYYLPTVTIAHLVPESKCSRHHIGSRIEASSYDSAESHADPKSVKIFNVPRWIISAMMMNYGKWSLSCITNKRKYRNYIEYRRLKGLLRGIHARSKLTEGNNPRGSVKAALKIAYLVDTFPKISETFILNEMLQVQARGHELNTFAYFRPDEDIVQPRAAEIKRLTYLQRRSAAQKFADHFLYFVDNPGRYISLFKKSRNPAYGINYVFKHDLRSAREIIAAKPDHIHAHFAVRASDLAFLIHLMSGIQFTFTSHHFDIFTLEQKNLALKSRHAKKHITISRFNLDYMTRQLLVSPESMCVVHCGIDFARNPPRASAGEKNIILNVARLSKVKAQHILIEACQQLKQENISFTLNIIGDGEERSSLEELIQKYRLEDCVHLLGWRTQSEVFEMLRASKVFALTSHSEGIPVSLMEAMACGVPVVATNVMGIPELITDGEEGYLFSVDNVPELVSKIKKLLSDPGLHQGFAERAIQKVRREFNLETETDKLITLWKN